MMALPLQIFAEQAVIDAGARLRHERNRLCAEVDDSGLDLAPIKQVLFKRRRAIGALEPVDFSNGDFAAVREGGGQSCMRLFGRKNGREREAGVIFDTAIGQAVGGCLRDLERRRPLRMRMRQRGLILIRGGADREKRRAEPGDQFKHTTPKQALQRTGPPCFRNVASGRRECKRLRRFGAAGTQSRILRWSEARSYGQPKGG